MRGKKRSGGQRGAPGISAGRCHRREKRGFRCRQRGRREDGGAHDAVYEGFARPQLQGLHRVVEPAVERERSSKRVRIG